MTLRCKGCSCIFGPNVIAEKEDKCPLCGNEEVVDAVTGEKAEWPAQRAARKKALAEQREARERERRENRPVRSVQPVAAAETQPEPAPPAPDVEVAHPHPDGPQPEAEPTPPSEEKKTPPPVTKPAKHSKR